MSLEKVKGRLGRLEGPAGALEIFFIDSDMTDEERQEIERRIARSQNAHVIKFIDPEMEGIQGAVD